MSASSPSTAIPAVAARVGSLPLAPSMPSRWCKQVDHLRSLGATVAMGVSHRDARRINNDGPVTVLIET